MPFKMHKIIYIFSKKNILQKCAPTLHKIFRPVTRNTLTFLFGLPVIGKKITTKFLLNLETFSIHWKKQHSFPSLEHYIKLIKEKKQRGVFSLSGRKTNKVFALFGSQYKAYQGETAKALSFWGAFSLSLEKK